MPKNKTCKNCEKWKTKAEQWNRESDYWEEQTNILRCRIYETRQFNHEIEKLSLGIEEWLTDFFNPENPPKMLKKYAKNKTN